MKRIWIVVLFALGAVSCYAPLIDRPEGSSFYNEGSDQERSASQTGAIVDAVEPIKSFDDTDPRSGSRHSDKAASAMQSAANANQAATSLKQSDQDVKGGKSSGGSGNVMLGLLIAVLGIGALFGFRSYLDKVAGEPGAPKKF